MLALASEADAMQQQAEARVGAARVAWNRGDFDEAQQHLTLALALANACQDDDLLARVLNDLGNVAFRQGDFHTARDYYEQGLAMARQVGRQDAIADSLNNMGNVCNDLGETEAALDYNQQSADLMRETGNRFGLALTLNNQGNIRFTQSDYAGAEPFFREARDLFREFGHGLGEMTCHLNLGLVALGLGQLDAAEENARQSLAMAEAQGNRFIVAYAHHTLGNVARQRHDHVEALEHYAASLAIRREMNDRNGIGETLCGMAFVQLARQQSDAARELLLEALALAQEFDLTLLALTALTGLAELHLRAGDALRAAELLGLVDHHPVTSDELRQTRVAPVRHRLEPFMSEDVLATVWEDGAALVLDGVVMAELGPGG
jgi:tetratricopeptide (TPR) repeat protein